MDTTKKIHDVSASLFFLIVFAYLFAALAFRNGYWPSLMIFGMRLFIFLLPPFPYYMEEVDFTFRSMMPRRIPIRFGGF